MKKIIVSDTTALIILAKSNHLKLLENFLDKIYVPKAVYEEITIKDDIVKSRITSCGFIEKKQIKDFTLFKTIEKESNLDIGEMEAITLAIENSLDLIIDEKLGRKYAISKGIDIIGLLGILKINFLLKKIDYVELLYIFEEFKSVGFRISPKLEKEFLGMIR